jgi:uncharacterized protein
MTAPRLIVTASVLPQRWRNGGGLTRELLAWPEGAGWSLRISVADIEANGPFSAFPGVARWFTVIEGAGVELDIAGARHGLRPGDAPLAFDGAARTDCRLISGATRDLNLMLRSRDGRMDVARHAQDWQPGLACCGLYSAVAGHCVFGHDEQRAELPAHALLWFDEAPSRLCFNASDVSASPAGWWLAAGAPETP